MTLAEEIFWTRPPDDDDARPIDPLGLDAMREELSDRLVPSLTGRTWSHEEFFWSLVFVRWAEQEEHTDEARKRRFLLWERCLKVNWAHCRRDGFAGVTRATLQAAERDAPRLAFRPLLKNQQTQGLLGAHLVPLRKLGLVSEAALVATDDGSSLIVGAGPAPKLKDGDWGLWARKFREAGMAFGTDFKRRLRKRLAENMPDLYAALKSARWPKIASWKLAAQYIGPAQRPFALLADQFCPWAEDLRKQFHQLIRSSPKDPAPVLPPRLSRPIPRGLKKWEPLKRALRNWRRREADSVLAELHKQVFTERGYQDELWIRLEDGQRHTSLGRASSSVARDGSDCRWWNAVQLMRPGR
jgi:hypothetical protein